LFNFFLALYKKFQLLGLKFRRCHRSEV